MIANTIAVDADMRQEFKTWCARNGLKMNEAYKMDELTRNQIIIEQIKLLANDIVDILLKLKRRGV